MLKCMYLRIIVGPLESMLLINGMQIPLDLSMLEKNTLNIMTARIVDDPSLSSNKKFPEQMIINGRVM